MYDYWKHYWGNWEQDKPKKQKEESTMLLKEYLDELKALLPDWKCLVKVHGREVIRCTATKLDYDMLAGNLLYAPVGLVSYDYSSKTYIYYVD